MLVGTGRNQIIKRAEFAVAVVSQLGVGMTFVVENLVFQADGGTGGGFAALAGHRIKIGLNKKFDAAVATGCGFEIHGQLKVGIAFSGDNVAAGLGLAVAAGNDAKVAAADEPAVGRKIIRTGAAPAIGGFAVPQQ